MFLQKKSAIIAIYWQFPCPKKGHLMYNEDKPKKKRFKLFDTQREGKGVSKESANLPPRLKKFFILYRRDFFRLLSVNLFILLGNFPLIFPLIASTRFFDLGYQTHTSPVYGVLSGLMAHEGASPSLLALNGVIGASESAFITQPTSYIFFALGALTLFTFGIVNVGTTYILRNMVKSDPVFVWSDFWYAVRRNFKQAFFYGMLDFLLLVLIPINISIIDPGANFFFGLLYWLNLAIGLLYITMRCYIYIQMVTFDLSIRKILKNSLIFAFIGFKRMSLAFLGCAILIALTIFLAGTGILLALAIFIPLALLFSNCAYMTTYAAYYKIKEVMIDPYEAENAAEPVPSEGEAIEG